MDPNYSVRYQGRRWTIRYGSYSDAEQVAVNEVQMLVQKYLPYVVSVQPAVESHPPYGAHLILIGTPDNNLQIKAILAATKLHIDGNDQGYLLACLDSPWEKDSRVLLIAGKSRQGVRYAVQDLGKYLAATVAAKFLTSPEGRPDLRKALDALPDFQINASPAIEKRGIWTWGYVVRDYRRFFDHMARLRMNLVVIWNDAAPVNSHQVIDYAHHQGIAVVFGFQWGWGRSDLKLSNPDDRLTIKKNVLENYHRHYQSLPLDGIYFQTLTEHFTVEEHGLSTANAATLLVNDISETLLALNPNLCIYFGLHATSIQNHYIDLKKLDQRITIMWEDAGGIPFVYEPETDPKQPFEKTLDYSVRIATFRPGSWFAIVAKGWTTLRWEDEFEHHGPFILGEQSHAVIQQKLIERQTQWNRINALWIKNFPFAARFYREMSQHATAGMIVAGLVEDGGFEGAIQPSVALFAETLWNPMRSDEELLQAALNPYYQDD